MTYSCAKPFAALIVLTLVRDGVLGLDQRVAELWPAYAAHGKAGHDGAARAGPPGRAAGVPGSGGAGPVRRLRHPVRTARGRHAACTSRARPAPSTRLPTATSATSWSGWSPARTWRRGSPDSPIDQGWDLHLRVAGGDLARVADPVALEPGWPARYTDDPRWGPAMTRPAGLLDPGILGSERWRTTSFPAIGLHASARGLATFYGQLVAEDGTVAGLLGPELHRAYLGPQVTGHDLLLDREVTWTLGFQVDDADIGMGGAGGSSAWFSFTGQYAAAFVSRGLGTHDRGDEVYELLEEHYSRQ